MTNKKKRQNAYSMGRTKSKQIRFEYKYTGSPISVWQWKIDERPVFEVSPNIHLTNTQWSTTTALHFGVPIAALRSHVGKHIQSGLRRGVPLSLIPKDITFLRRRACGMDISSATTTASAAPSPTDSARREFHISARVLTALCKGTFRSAFPAMTDEDAVKIMNGIIPDLNIQLGHHSPDEH
jgi:hypothetical protein